MRICVTLSALSLALSACSGIANAPALEAGKTALQIRDRRFDGIIIVSIDKHADRYPMMKPLSRGYVSLDAGVHEIEVQCASDGSSGAGVLQAHFRAGHFYHVVCEKKSGTADIFLRDSVSNEEAARVRITDFTPNPR